MPSLPVLKQVLRELTSRKDAFRVPEPDLVMDDPRQVAAFHEAGREDGVMASVYLFHAAQVSEVIRPGETVLDLGCGPANQLGLIARLNPDVRFVGLDLSHEMLAMAERNLAARGIANVRFEHGDITDLSAFADGSLDAVISTVVLHHLPDEAALFRCLAEVNRVLKPGGGLYLVDLGHLKTEAAIHYFSHQYADREPPLFTKDYHHSLRAAFEADTWKQGWAAHLAGRGKLHTTLPLRFMVVVKGPVRRALPDELRGALRRQLEGMTPHHRTDFKDLVGLFRMGGLRSPEF